jgi:oxygen-independent coproporphyrinogen-3 oxidase
VSVYMLEVDEDSRLGRELLAGGTRYHAHFVPDEEAVADFYLEACARLTSAEIAQYEISNFAREGFESCHNLKYWTRQPYFGFGVDAHSMLAVAREGHEFSRADGEHKIERGFGPSDIEAVRFASADSLEKYTDGAAVQRTSVSHREAIEECFFLGLRLTQGIRLQELAEKFGKDALQNARASITELVKDGLMEHRGDCVCLTSRGRLLSNEVFERFLLIDEIVR